MKKIAKFLLAVFAFAPAHVVAAPVATTAGNNLTGYNGASESYINNQWNNAMNPRSNTVTAKADFGNCEAIILRCAKPKCSGGGCADVDVAKSIVSGCVKSNTTCKKHGDDLVDYIAAQLVSSSSSAVAEAQAQAAAAQSAAEQNSAAMQQQMAQMQQQMIQMQQQNNQQMASLQSALEESQRASQEAATAAATVATQQQASVANPDTGLTVTQTAAAKSGVSDDVITRATITGQIMSSMEGVDQSLDKLKTTMRDAFRYAGCNEINGDNCTGPKRVKKFKDLAMKFFDPYDALVENLEDALIKAQTVGVDMSDIYMMLSGSCNRWAEYICTYDGETFPVYHDSVMQINVCTSGNCTFYNEPANCIKSGENTYKSVKGVSGILKEETCFPGQVIPPENMSTCRVNKIYNDADGYDKIQEKMLNPDSSSTGIIRIGCASDIINSGIFRRRASARKGGVSIDILEYLISQDAPNSFSKEERDNVKNTVEKYCKKDNDTLRKATSSRTVPTNKCCEKQGENCNKSCEDEDSSYIDPVYGLCSVHAYNIGETVNPTDEDVKSEMQENIALKSTVIAQQMYKQYNMIESMIKRLKIQLEKSALKASLQVAGASGSGSDADGGSDKVEYSDCSGKDPEEALSCLRSNYSKLKTFVDKGNLRNDVVKQIVKDCKVLYYSIPVVATTTNMTPKFTFYNECENESVVKSKKKEALQPISGGITQLNNLINQQKAEERRANR